MAYSDWTLETVKKAFQLEEINAAGIFAEVEPVEPSTHLATTLARTTQLSGATKSLVSSPVWWHKRRECAFGKSRISGHLIFLALSLTYWYN